MQRIKIYLLVVVTLLANGNCWKLAGRAVLSPDNIVEQFSLGQRVSGDMPIYFEQKDIIGNDEQGTITAEIIYPKSSEDAVTPNEHIITRVQVFLEGSVGFESQIYVIEGGIMHSSIILDITTSSTNNLHYAVVIYGILA